MIQRSTAHLVYQCAHAPRSPRRSHRRTLGEGQGVFPVFLIPSRDRGIAALVRARGCFRAGVSSSQLCMRRIASLLKLIPLFLVECQASVAVCPPPLSRGESQLVLVSCGTQLPFYPSAPEGEPRMHWLHRCWCKCRCRATVGATCHSFLFACVSFLLLLAPPPRRGELMAAEGVALQAQTAVLCCTMSVVLYDNQWQSCGALCPD